MDGNSTSVCEFCHTGTDRLLATFEIRVFQEYGGTLEYCACDGCLPEAVRNWPFDIESGNDDDDEEEEDWVRSRWYR